MAASKAVRSYEVGECCAEGMCERGGWGACIGLVDIDILAVGQVNDESFCDKPPECMRYGVRYNCVASNEGQEVRVVENGDAKVMVLVTTCVYFQM